MIEIIETYKATICFTAPTAYRAMMAAMDKGADLSSLRIAVSAGETLPAPVFEEWTQEDRQADPGRHRRHRDAAYLHLQHDRRCAPGSTGRPVAGYEAKIVDDDMNEVPRRHGRPARRARSDGLPLSRRQAPGRLRARRLEPHRRRLHAGRGRPLPFRRAHRRHDRLRRLQHRRPRGRGGAACARRCRGMRGDRRAGCRARPDRRGARRVEAGCRRPTRPARSACRIT